jgi:CheY-like chemotaxis protein
MPTAASPRVLLVDDYPEAAEVWGVFLRAAGFDVDTAATGTEALTRALSHPPDAVVMDLNLPDRSGIDVARALLADATTEHVPLLAVTGSVDRISLATARTVFRHVLSKPCDPDQLVRHLREVIAPRE